eukprot:TRINITY_DN11582_c0_g1_i1.p1 TRINITY_DN11582_c0_g1~~TRINITY_DN11582_c0_g1_i1.p1  ORF type:complete len:483 (+),score=71.67 TRINITY_DN11582_c0_g1_i1:70-1518(+)
MQIVVIGGGIAAYSCAEALARIDKGIEITVVTASAMLKGTTMIRRVTKLLEEFRVEHESFEKLLQQRIRVIRGVVTKLDPLAKLVYLGAESLKYDRVCVCSGAIPRLIDTVHPEVLGIRDTDTVEDYKRRLDRARRAIVIGNGGIAMELIGEVQNCEVVWAVKDNYIGNTFFDESASAFLLPQLAVAEAHGSTFASTNTATRTFVPARENPSGLPPREWKLPQPTTADVSSHPDRPDVPAHVGSAQGDLAQLRLILEFQALVKQLYSKQEYVEAGHVATEDWPLYCELTNGKIYGCDFLVSATGVIPNTKFLGPEFQRAADGGVMADRQLRTSVSDVFAAGDVCSLARGDADTWFQMRLWDQAKMLGVYAAYSMLGQADDPSVPCNFELFAHVTKFFGYPIVLLGQYNAQGLGDDHNDLIRIDPGQEYVKFVLHKGRLVGAMLIGDTGLEETAQNLILNQIDLSRYGAELLNPDVDIEDFFD